MNVELSNVFEGVTLFVMFRELLIMFQTLFIMVHIVYVVNTDLPCKNCRIQKVYHVKFTVALRISSCKVEYAKCSDKVSYAAVSNRI